MRPVPNPDATERIHLPISRRALLRGGAALGVTTLTSVGLGSATAAAAPSALPATTHLVKNYQPSQPTGWPATPGQTFSTTIGGHTSARKFTFNGKPYRISLLSFDQAGNDPDPIYEDVPTDPDLAFKQTLADAFGAHYSFHYVGGFPGRNEFNVQSYSVFVREPTETDPTTGFGGGLYVAYDPDLRRGDPGIHETLQWIQVVRRFGATHVDNIWRANPWYLYGGLVSVHGTELFNFHDVPQAAALGDVPLDDQFLAETFLAQDTGIIDAAGKGVVKIFGGFKWGWQVHGV
ncbi:hypothetical protein C1I99_04710 [Micromonospora deserti]|uniref:Uncharacterized protein n=2 Tax=Micromonospora deserti TaxID=2070366 RepID=A0A2W2DMA3_9ACTN|nr:hypothetical protein C1I99_04710 [Micromonospora deserti]